MEGGQRDGVQEDVEQTVGCPDPGSCGAVRGVVVLEEGYGVKGAIVGFGEAGMEAVTRVDAGGVDGVECAVEKFGGHG